MKIIVTGSLGNISAPLAKKLIGAGHEVVVISSKPDKRKEIEHIGASAAIGNIEDVDFLSTTFAAAHAVYLMVPPTYFHTGEEPIGYYTRIGQAYAEAVIRSGVRHVVDLSSFGAHLDRGTGFILGSHRVENILNELPAPVSVTHLRPTSFYYNLLSFIPMIKHTGVIAANYGGDRMIPMVAPVDIATAAFEELTGPVTGSARKVRYVCSEELTGNEAAAILGAAIGKPDLRWHVISDDEARAGLLQHGMPPVIVDNIIELYACLYSGKMAEDYERHRPALSETKLTTFAKDFAEAYQSK